MTPSSTMPKDVSTTQSMDTSQPATPKPHVTSSHPNATTIAKPDDTSPTLGYRSSLTALRVVFAGMLVGLLWKITFFRYADAVYASIPIQQDFFPAFFEHALTLRIAYLSAIAAICTAWFANSHWNRIAATVLSLLACSVMLLHQGSYNDMTFVTVWWCNVFALWYTCRMEVDSETQLGRKAAFLSRLLVSVVLLGGAVGKWTGEYWSGEVLYEIYFRERDFWVFNGLRSWLDADSLRWAATVYSRKVVLVESIAGLGLWLLPARWAAVAGVVIFSSIAIFSNFLLFSVLGPLIGLALVGWFCLLERPLANYSA